MMTINLGSKVRPVLFLSTLAALFFATAWGRVPQLELKYQDRGDRYEGVRGTPVSDKVELISVLADYNEGTATLPELFRLKFFLKEKTSVFVTVRELDNKRNYWLDRVRPRGGWREGFGNEFVWSTAEVVRPLKDVQLSGLGALVQLGNDQPSMDVFVAPAILYHTHAPSSVGSYLFTFKIGRRADVTCSISEDRDNSPVLSTQSFNMLGQRPKTVTWKAANARNGWYRMRISVVYSQNGQEVNKIIRFYHNPSVT